MAVMLRRAACLLLAVGLLAGCAGLGTKLESPKVSILGVQTLTTDMFAQKFKVRLKVENPNDLELKVTGLEYQILLMGDSFAEGNSTDRFLLPAKGEAVSSLGRLISRVGGGKLENVDYEIVGTVYVDKGMIKKIPFQDHGQVDFSRAGRKADR